MLMLAKDDTPKEPIERGRLFKREQNPACYKEFQDRNYNFNLCEREITAHYACRNALN